MPVVTANELARVLRRHERRRALPYVLLAALLVAGGIVVWCLGGAAFVVGALTSGGIALAYLGQYLHDLARGRTVDPIAGAIELSLPSIQITAIEYETRFALSDVVMARHIVGGGFEDLKGLTDVLELGLREGPTLRIPATFAGFDGLVAALPEAEWIDVDAPSVQTAKLPTATTVERIGAAHARDGCSPIRRSVGRN